MQKLLIILLCLLFTAGIAACGSGETETGNGGEEMVETGQEGEVYDETPDPESDRGEGAVDGENGEDGGEIKLQSFVVTVPPGHVGTGGDDGVKYNNAIIVPEGDNPAYEIEVGSTFSFALDDYEGAMSVRGSYNDVEVVPLDSENWEIEGLAYTYDRIHGEAFSSYTEFREEYGTSMVIGFFRYAPYSEETNQYGEMEIRALQGSVEEYRELFKEFASRNIRWRDLEE